RDRRSRRLAHAELLGSLVEPLQRGVDLLEIVAGALGELGGHLLVEAVGALVCQVKGIVGDVAVVARVGAALVVAADHLQGERARLPQAMLEMAALVFRQRHGGPRSGFILYRNVAPNRSVARALGGD